MQMILLYTTDCGLGRLTLKEKFNILIREHGKQMADFYGVYGN